MKRSSDPTKAVLGYVKREMEHIKELRRADKELRNAETGRLNAIRDVDMKAVEVLAGNVESTRLALALQSKEVEEKLSTRITFLEGNQAQNQGKSSIWANPILIAILSAALAYAFAVFTK